MPGEFERHVEAANEAGIQDFQIREKSWTARDLFLTSASLTAILSETAQLFLNDRLDVVAAMDHPSVGAHLGGHSLPWQAARTLVPAVKLGVSTHSLAEAEQAVDAGACYALLSPIYQPVSKPDDTRAPLGPKVFESVSQPGRVLALGGVTSERMDALAKHGARGVAILGACWGRAPDETYAQCQKLVDTWSRLAASPSSSR